MKSGFKTTEWWATLGGMLAATQAASDAQVYALGFIVGMYALSRGVAKRAA